MNDSNLRLFYYTAEPYRFGCAYHSKLAVTSQCMFPGIIAEIWSAVLQIAGLHFELVTLVGRDYSWEEGLGLGLGVLSNLFPIYLFPPRYIHTSQGKVNV